MHHADLHDARETLEIEFPSPVIKNMATSFQELKPMNRFLKETCEMQDKMPDMQTYSTTSSVAAVKDSAEETGSSDGGILQGDEYDDKPALSQSGAVCLQSAMLSMAGTWSDGGTNDPNCGHGPNIAEAL